LASNGDRWLLVRDDTSRVFVRHEANIPSGGTVTDSEIADFWARVALVRRSRSSSG